MSICSSLAIINSLPLFDDSSENEITEIAAHSVLRNCHRGQLLYAQGDTISYWYVVFSGSIQIFRETPYGREMTSSLLGHGDILCGSDIFLENRVTQSNARALEETVLVAIPISWIKENFLKFDHLCKKIMIIISRHLVTSQIEKEQQSSMTACQIITCYFQHLCASHKLNPAGFTLPYKKHMISSRLSMEQETFSRAIRRLRDYGLVIVGKRARFTSIEAAQKLSCGACSMSENCAARDFMTASALSRKTEAA